MSLGHGASIVRDGLVLHLDAANPKSYPGSGTTWYDLSGKGNNATLYNSPIFQNNRALFNGTSSYAQIPYDAENFTFSYEQTIMIVLSPTENDSTRRNPYNQSYAASGTWTQEADGKMNFYYGQGSSTGETGLPYTSMLAPEGVAQNETAMMCSVRSASNNYRRWFKNGEMILNEDGVVYNPVTNSTNVIRIGRGYSAYYKGYIDCVFVYNVALTEQQISQNFNALRGRYGI